MLGGGEFGAIFAEFEEGDLCKQKKPAALQILFFIQQNRILTKMEGEIINQRYKAIRELKEPRDGKIYFLVEDIENGKEKSGRGGYVIVFRQRVENAQGNRSLQQAARRRRQIGSFSSSKTRKRFYL